MAFINISTNQIDLYFSGMPDNSDRSKGLVGTYVKTTLPILLIYILNTVRVVLTYGPTSPLLRVELSAGRVVWHSPLLPLKYKSQSDWLKYL